MINALFEYQFMRNALIACILASIVCGFIGVIIIEKKLVMMSGGIAHTAFGGVGLGYLLGFEPIFGALGFSVLASICIGAIHKKVGIQSDVIVGLFWSLGMALGILFVGLRPGYPPDMNSYLFGNILSVTNSSIIIMFVLTAFIVFTILCMFQTWKAYLFDAEFSSVIGINTSFLDYLILVIVAITVVALIRVAGIILVLALLTAPAATSALFTKKLHSRIMMSIIIGILYCLTGLYIAYKLDIASGACIVIISVAVYVIALGISKIKQNLHKARVSLN